MTTTNTTDTVRKLRFDIPKRLLMVVDADALNNRDQGHIVKSYMFSEQVTFKVFADVFFKLYPYTNETKMKTFDLSRQFCNIPLQVYNNWLKNAEAKVRKLYATQNGYDEISIRSRDTTDYIGIMLDKDNRLWVLTKNNAAMLVDNEVIDFGKTSENDIAGIFFHLLQVPGIVYEYVFNNIIAPRYKCDYTGEKWFPIMTRVTTDEFIEGVKLDRDTAYNRRIYKGCWDIALQRDWKNCNYTL